MKKLLLILGLVFVGFQSHSQILITLLLGDKLNSDELEFGLEGGINISNISGLQTYKPLLNFNLGFYFDIKLKEHWFLYTGVLVKSNLGVDKLSPNDLQRLGATIYKFAEEGEEPIVWEGDYSQRMRYFLVPLLAKYKYKNYIYGEIGPQAGLMYKSWVQFDSDLEGRDATIKEYNSDNLNRFDFGLMVGAGYTMWQGTGWTFGLKYYFGFIDVYRNIPNTKNSSLFAKVNIPIGAGDRNANSKVEK